MRSWLKILPTFLYERIVRQHGEIVVIQSVMWSSDGRSIMVRTLEPQ